MEHLKVYRCGVAVAVASRLLDYICLPEGIFVLHHLFTWSKLNVSHHEVLCLGFILTQNCLTLL